MKITFLDLPDFKTGERIEKVFGCTNTVYPIPNIINLINARILEGNGNTTEYYDISNEKWKWEDFKNFLEKNNSDVFVIHSVNLSMDSDMRNAQLMKKKKPDSKIIFTGPAPTYFSKNFLKNEDFIVVRGEPFKPLKNLINGLNENKSLEDIKGISFIKENKIRNTGSEKPISTLDGVPFPAREKLNSKLYINPKLDKIPWTIMLTSLGCSGQCIYCVPNSLSFSEELEYKMNNNCKPPVKLRSPQNIINEFKKIEKQGYKSVSIIDDNFIWGEKRTREICEGIKNMNIEWGCLARVDFINENIAKYLKDAGCKYVDIGIESMNQEVLDYVRKGIKVKDIRNAVRILKKYKIPVKVNILLGVSPKQTREDILNTLKEIKKLNPTTAMFSIVSPFPGTEFYKICKENNYFLHNDYEATNVQKNASISLPYLSKEELESLVKKCNHYFFFSPITILSNLRVIKHPRLLIRTLKSLKNKID